MIQVGAELPEAPCCRQLRNVLCATTYVAVSGWYLSILALAEYWSMRVVTVFTVGFFFFRNASYRWMGFALEANPTTPTRRRRARGRAVTTCRPLLAHPAHLILCHLLLLTYALVKHRRQYHFVVT